MTLNEFVSMHVYPGETVEIAGVGPDEGNNPVRYCGPSGDIPAELLDAEFRYAASTSEPHTLRIECSL